MMGERQVAQEALFYEFSLERHIPADQWVRAIDRFVDLSEIRGHLRPFYSETGRPSIDPELMIRMLLILLLRHPLRAPPVRRGSPESRLSVVLPARARRRRPRSLDLLEEPAWSLP